MDRSATPSRRIPLAVFLVGAAGLVAASFLLDRSMRAGARARGGAELDAVALLKVDALVDHRAATARLAESYAEWTVLGEAARRAPGRLGAELERAATARLTGEARRQGYAAMALLTPDGREIVAYRGAGGAAAPFSPALLAAARAGPSATALAALPEEGLARLDAAAAVRDAAGQAVAVVYLRSDLTTFLDRLSHSWPVPNQSGEAVLVRRDGDDAIFITEPRGRTGWRMRVRVPLVERQRGLVRGALGQTGVFQAVDFRDVPILVASRPVPDADWLVMTRLDVEEIEAPVARQVRVVVGGLGLLLLGSAAALVLWYRREDRQHRALAEASRALEEGEARLRLALAGTSFVWEWDVVAGRLSADPEWARVLGVPAATVTGSLEEILDAVVVEEDRAYVRGQFQAHLTGAAPTIEAEFRSPSATGEQRWVSIRGRVFERDAAGRPARAIGVVADVTARRRVQEQLERSERLLSLGTLAAGVAHEINNPLTYVLDAAGQLAAELPALLPSRPDLAEAAGYVRDGAERVREVVRRLRSFSRPGSERRAAVDPAEEVAAAVRMAGNELRHRARLEVRRGPAPLVLAGEHQLGQIFLNLLLNAAHAVEEAHRPDPTIAVAVGTDGAGWASVEVRDDGVGIPAALLPHLFEPFFTTRGRGTGTGLGLAIAWAEVSAAGGRIEVESEVGRGSTFRVLLPPAPPAAARPGPPRPDAGTPAGPGPAAAPAPAARPRVLVVDDEPLVARAVGRALGAAYQAVLASSAEEALQRLAEGPYAAVVCDLMMPGVTGMELHERVRARDAGQAGRFVFVTGGAFTDAARRFLEDTAAPTVEKPFEPEALREAVRRVAQGTPPST